MLKSITLRFTENEPLEITTAGVTIFVGPNNSGKSLVLKELQTAFSSNTPYTTGKVLQDFEIEWPELTEVQTLIDSLIPLQTNDIQFEHLNLGALSPYHGGSHSVHYPTMLEMVRTRQNKAWWVSQVLRWELIRLDGRTRFDLTNDQTGGDLQSASSNMLTHLFKNDFLRQKVREQIFDAFGLYYVIDPTNLGQLRIKLSQRPPLDDEQSLNVAARAYHGQALHIKEASDGVQAFTGITTAILSAKFHTVLIDEPEAFLHPPLARKLGRNLAKLNSERGGCLMASTHSSDFLMGCLQGAADVSVIRLEYNNGRSRGKMVNADQLREFFRRPLMRSANVISALFHDGVVVCESDNDRAFYSEIYYRLVQQEPDAPSLLFVNAQNKQTIRDIIGPLRQFGVPAVGIADIDLVNDFGKNWTGWMKAAQIPRDQYHSYRTTRLATAKIFEATGRNIKTDGGINLLGGDDFAGAATFFDSLDKYGIFAVRNGEVENWLENLNVPGDKTKWTIAMLNRLGSDPADANYIMPGDNDVWAFMRSIAIWVKDPGRAGTA